MNALWSAPLESASSVALVVFSISIGLCLIRLVRGPSLPDRVVALDLSATLLVGFLVVFGISKGFEDLVRVATVLALINFLGTVGFAVYSCRRAQT